LEQRPAGHRDVAVCFEACVWALQQGASIGQQQQQPSDSPLCPPLCPLVCGGLMSRVCVGFQRQLLPISASRVRERERAFCSVV